MPTPQQLEVAAHSLIAVLGLWLGLTVFTRSRALPSRVFTLLSLALVVWSAAIILQRLSSSPGAVHTGRSIEEMAAAVIVPATAHLSLAIATEGHPTIGRRRVIVDPLRAERPVRPARDPDAPARSRSPTRTSALARCPACCSAGRGTSTGWGRCRSAPIWLLQAHRGDARAGSTPAAARGHGRHGRRGRGGRRDPVPADPGRYRSMDRDLAGGAGDDPGRGRRPPGGRLLRARGGRQGVLGVARARAGPVPAGRRAGRGRHRQPEGARARSPAPDRDGPGDHDRALRAGGDVAADAVPRSVTRGDGPRAPASRARSAGAHGPGGRRRRAAGPGAPRPCARSGGGGRRSAGWLHRRFDRRHA